MTHPKTDFKAFEEAMELLTEKGHEALAEVFRIFLNHTTQSERSHVLSTQSHERTPEWKGYANGLTRSSTGPDNVTN